MGKYHVAAPDGREFEIEGDAPPSESDLEQIFGARSDKPSEPTAGDALDAVFQNSLKTGARIPSDAARSLMDAAVNNAKYPAYEMPEGVGQGVVRRIGESKPVQLLSRPLLDLAPSSESIRSVLTLPFQLAQERAENTPDNQSSPIAEKVMAATPSDKALAVATGATRAVGDMASFFTSPIGIATLGMGALPATAQKGIALAFAAQMASDLPDTANELMSELQKPEDQRDYEKISKLATGGAAATILTGIGMKHGMAETPAKAFPSEINLEKQGAPNAKTIRENTGQLPESGAVATGSEKTGVNDLEQNPSVQPEPLEQGVAPAPSATVPEKVTSVPAPASEAAQEIGLQAKRNDAAGMNTEGMPPEMVAAIREKHGPQIEFTDKRPDSPHPGMTFYMPEDATKEQIVARYQEKAKEFAANPEVMPDLVESGVNTGALGDVGMGAARDGEVASSGDSSVAGLAERVRKEREASGHTAPTEPGAGIAPEASVERGRQLLPTSNPEQIMSEFEKSGRFSSDDVAVVRAKAEELARATNKAEEKFGTYSNEFRQAFKTESDWAARTKKMQTEWAKSGHAQQGEVDIDTGTFSGLARAFKEDTGRDFTPEQAGTAKKKAGKVKLATAAEDLSKQRLFDQLDKQAGGTRVEQRAFDAANKTVREWAIKRAKLENEARTAKTVREQATIKVQLDAVTRAQDAANKTVREAQIRLAKAENDARVKQAQQANDIRDVQVQAAKRAQDAADNRVRELNAELARDENRKRVATAQKEKDFAEESRRATQAKLDKAHKEARLAAVQRAKAEVKANIARADTPTYAWKKAKEYIEKGMDDFDEIRNKLATDLGISVNKVTEALGKDKRTKFLADDLWRKQQVARELRTQAKLWLKQASTPGYLRALQSVPKILFSLKVGFHGTVALGTHAPMVAFQPRFWKTYVSDFAKMYRMIGNRAYYESQVQDLIRRPNYTTARRAGLVNDPFTYEDFNSPDTAKYFGGLAGMGNRGYSVLKILRQDMFDQMWNKLPRTAQMPEIAEAIADGLNHSTGVVKGRAPTGSNLALFAPRLEASRVAWLAVDPVKALASVVNWKNATAGEKVFAINQIKEKAWVAGTMFGILALNQGFLSAIGSKQKVNFDDPLKSDFLKFKIAGMSFSYGNAMISMARLPVRLYQIRQSSGGKSKNLVYPDESSYTVLGEYVRSQLSPFASLASSLWFKSDWQNRPLPNSNRPVPKRLADQGIKAYTWPEFWSEQFLPIPFEEAAREVWKNGLGMSDEQIGSLRKAMATIAVMGATGGRLVDDAAPHTIHERLSQFNKNKPDADYGALRAALDKDDTAGAKAAYEELRKARKPDVIDNAMRPFNTVRIPGTEYWETHYKPLTGSHKDEVKFLQSLDAEGKMLYEKNKAERLEQYKKFQQMLKQK